MKMIMLHKCLQGELVGGPAQLQDVRGDKASGKVGDGQGGYVVWAERVYLRGSW